MMNWKECETTLSRPVLRYCPGICLKGLSKNTKIVSKDSWSPGPDLNAGLSEHEVRVLTTRLLLSLPSIHKNPETGLNYNILFSCNNITFFSLWHWSGEIVESNITLVFSASQAKFERNYVTSLYADNIYTNKKQRNFHAVLPKA
jgi:hypothetical protein